MDDESARLLAAYVDGSDDAAAKIYHKYINRMIALARTKLSERIQRRVDPEDIAQSAIRSFFRKARDEQIVLLPGADLWCILAGFTVKKAQKRVEEQLAQRRDPRREVDGSAWVKLAIEGEPTAAEVACIVDQLEHYMQRIIPRNRLILELRLQGESVADIAEELKQHTGQLGESVANTSEAVIRQFLRKAKTDLRRMLFED